MSEHVAELKQALLNIDKLQVRNILTGLYAPGEELRILEELIVPVMEEIGTEWEAGDVALTQVYMSGKICEEILDSVLPHGKTGGKAHPVMAIAVLHDYHILGKRIVTSVLKASGYSIIDYGAGVTVDDLIVKVRDDQVKILLISSLMLNSALKVKELQEKIKLQEMNIKIVVGGAPFRFDRALWREVGADAMAANASEGINIVSDLVEAVGI